MTELIGRERELASLLAWSEALQRGRGRLITLAGEAGMGKSALASGLLRQLRARHPELLIHSSGCVDGAGSYYVFQKLAEDLFTVEGPEGRTPRRTGVYLRVLEESLGPWLGVVPVIGSLAEALWETSRNYSAATSRRTVAGDLKQDVLQSFSGAFRKLAAAKPLVLFLDDLHWADASSVSLLNLVLQECQDLPLLVVGTYRPTDARAKRPELSGMLAELKRRRVAEEMVLERLGADDTATLIRRHGPTAAARADEIGRLSGGNPLFAIELAHCAQEGGHVAELPTTLEGAFDRRVAHLTDDLRSTLHGASVQGDAFTCAIVSRVLEEEEADLEDRMKSLETVHGLVHELGEARLPRGQQTTRYAFAHGLVHHRIYHELSPARRRKLHARVATALEDVYKRPQDRVAVEAELAEHWTRAGEHERALTYRLTRAERLADAGEIHEAHGLVEACWAVLDLVEAPPDDPRRADVALLATKTSLALERIDDARRWHALAAPSLRAAGDVREITSLALEAVLLRPTSYRQSREKTLAAVARLRELEPRRALEVIEILPDTGDVDAATLAWLKAQQLTPWQRAVLLLQGSGASWAPLPLREVHALIAELNAVLSALSQEKAPKSRVAALGCQAIILLLQYRWHEASTLLVTTAAMPMLDSDRRALEQLEVLVAQGRGHLTAAVERQRALLERQPAWDLAARVESRASVASCLLALERTDDARREIDEGWQELQRAGALHLRSRYLDLRAQIAESTGDATTARRLMREAAEVADAWGDPDSDARPSLAALLARQGRFAEGAAALGVVDPAAMTPEELRSVPSDRADAWIATCEQLGDDVAAFHLRRERLGRYEGIVELDAFVRLALTLGHEREAVEAVDSLARAFPDGGVAPILVAAAGAQIATWRGRKAEARGLIAQALDLAVAESCPWIESHLVGMLAATGLDDIDDEVRGLEDRLAAGYRACGMHSSAAGTLWRRVEQAWGAGRHEEAREGFAAVLGELEQPSSLGSRRKMLRLRVVFELAVGDAVAARRACDELAAGPPARDQRALLADADFAFADSALGAGDTGEAERCVLRAANRHLDAEEPSDALRVIARGLELLPDGRHDEIVDRLCAWAEANVTSAEPDAMRWYLCERLDEFAGRGDLAAARAECSRWLAAVDPSDEGNRYERAVVLNKLGLVAEAAGDLAEARRFFAEARQDSATWRLSDRVTLDCNLGRVTAALDGTEAALPSWDAAAAFAARMAGAEAALGVAGQADEYLLWSAKRTASTRLARLASLASLADSRGWNLAQLAPHVLLREVDARVLADQADPAIEALVTRVRSGLESLPPAENTGNWAAFLSIALWRHDADDVRASLEALGGAARSEDQAPDTACTVMADIIEMLIAAGLADLAAEWLEAHGRRLVDVEARAPHACRNAILQVRLHLLRGDIPAAVDRARSLPVEAADDLGADNLADALSVRAQALLAGGHAGEAAEAWRALAVEYMKGTGVPQRGLPLVAGLFASGDEALARDVVAFDRRSSEARPFDLITRIHADLARDWLDALGSGGAGVRAAWQQSAARSVAPEAPSAEVDALVLDAAAAWLAGDSDAAEAATSEALRAADAIGSLGVMALRGRPLLPRECWPLAAAALARRAQEPFAPLALE